MTDTITTTRNDVSIPEDMLERFRARAGELDATNSYFREDLAELREIGYLSAAVPAELGGWGLDLEQMAQSQRRLARYAPATALSMTMHTYWIGIAVELEALGDTSLRWILEEAVDGQVFAAGHAETGNDMPVLLSTCKATRVEGGYVLDGRKQFGSNGPAWRWLGAHAMDVDAPGGPQTVHAFVERSSPGGRRRRPSRPAVHRPGEWRRPRRRRRRGSTRCRSSGCGARGACAGAGTGASALRLPGRAVARRPTARPRPCRR